MKYEEMKVTDVVKYINDQLILGRTMKDIEETDFQENKGVIQKRLNRKGYIKINNQFVAAREKNNTTNNTKIIQTKKNNTTSSNINVVNKDKQSIKYQKAFSNYELEKFEKLLNLDVDILNNMINDYTTKNNTKSSIIEIKDKTTVVTSLRVNKELYEKLKEYAKEREIKIGDIFNEMMLDYLNKISY